MAIIAVVVAVALAVAGLSWWAVSAHHASRLAQAQSTCAQAADRLRVAQNKYDALHDGDAANAATITSKQVADATTVTVLASTYAQQAPQRAACNVDGATALGEAAVRIDKNTAWYDQHTVELRKATDAVNKSHDAKTLQDARGALDEQVKAAQAKVKGSAGKVKDDKTRKDLKTLIDKASKIKDGTDVKAMNSQAKQLNTLMGKVDASMKAKTDADRKAAEEQAQREAEAAAAAAQAQAQQQAQQYVAPQQSYTPTYTVPQQSYTPQYTAPQQTTPQYTAPAQPAQPATPSKPNTGSGPISGGHGMTGPCDAACQAEAMKPIQR
ncbi:hypothetical protein [Bifidobacterium pseudolongum]|uniref:hypothetical protein n=1 Tax=Bifidobacterium pseudolongum TaxID=1694 RepID=UPI0011C0CF56|nr:hypothetical protein [Bifidobacterium pseudolongum]